MPSKNLPFRGFLEKEDHSSWGDDGCPVTDYTGLIHTYVVLSGFSSTLRYYLAKLESALENFADILVEANENKKHIDRSCYEIFNEAISESVHNIGQLYDYYSKTCFLQRKYKKIGLINIKRGSEKRNIKELVKDLRKSVNEIDRHEFNSFVKLRMDFNSNYLKPLRDIKSDLQKTSEEVYTLISAIQKVPTNRDEAVTMIDNLINQYFTEPLKCDT